MTDTPPAVKLWTNVSGYMQNIYGTGQTEYVLATDYERLERELKIASERYETFNKLCGINFGLNAKVDQLERDLAEVRAGVQDIVNDLEECTRVPGAEKGEVRMLNALRAKARRLLAGRGKSQIFPSSDHYDDHLDDDVLEEL